MSGIDPNHLSTDYMDLSQWSMPDDYDWSLMSDEALDELLADVMGVLSDAEVMSDKIQEVMNERNA